jgi:predicted NBD/HSP70 family sugar kinase
MSYLSDPRIVATLDAGGTNLVFASIQGGEYIRGPYTLPAMAHDLDACLMQIIKGFEMLFDDPSQRPIAISFAFPGPADYPRGIIGGFLPNFPSFREGVALGPLLEDHFGVPVFINNDGDLFAYGESLCGLLPEVNKLLEEAGSQKRFRNLIGYTVGTGLGIGMVINGHLNRGDNSCVETFCLPHPSMHDIIIEEGASTRAVCRVYGELTGEDVSQMNAQHMADIIQGKCAGNAAAAREAFAAMGRTLGAAIATSTTLIDGIVVLGGGVMAAKEWIMPALMEELHSTLSTIKGEKVPRVQMKVYDLDNPDTFLDFAHGEVKRIKVYGQERYVDYDVQKRIGIGISKMGANKAVSIGAYAFALHELDQE